MSDIERVFEGIILQHSADKDGGTAGYVHVLGWLQSAATEDQRIIRELLLDHVRAGTPRKWDIALAVLASDAAPEAAAQLETMARSTEERSPWRDSIILSLAKMAHRPALDLCLDGLRAGPGFQADSFGLLANLIRLEPEVALNSALAYFVEEADSSEQRRERAESRSWVFFTVYSSVNPDCSLELIRRTMRVSPRASELLIGGLSTWCKDLLTRAWWCRDSLVRFGLPNDRTVQAILDELQALERQLTNSYLHELLLSPTSLSEACVGWPQTFAATAKNGIGAPMPGLLVRLHVTGANPQLVEGTTDSKGCAVIMYIGTHAGVDRVQASAIARGPAVVSNTVRTVWVNQSPPLRFS